RVAIPAIQPQPRHVMLMAEGHLLLHRDVCVRGIRRPVNEINTAPKDEKTEEPADERYSRDAVAGLSENLGHTQVRRHQSSAQHAHGRGVFHSPAAPLMPGLSMTCSHPNRNGASKLAPHHRLRNWGTLPLFPKAKSSALNRAR